MLKLEHISKSYTLGSGQTECVLADIDLSVEKGESVAIVGPSGSGKSTLLNIIGALDRPSGGKVLLEGTDLSGLTDARLAELRNGQIGFVFQLHHLLSQCTVLENVLIPTLARKGGLDEAAEQRAIDMLDRVGLIDHRDHRPGELSGGQMQRVAVVRALINEPKLLLADEPTGSLDRQAAENIAELLVELNRSEGVALIVVTHSMRLAGYMGKVLELSDGVLREGRS